MVVERLKLLGSKSANSGSVLPLLAVASGTGVGTCVGWIGTAVGCAGAIGPAQAEAEIMISKAIAIQRLCRRRIIISLN
jgi:hypothetical protein